MLKILFSPSEGKNTGGQEEKKDLFGAISARDEILKSYSQIVLGEDELSIRNLFGIKKFDSCKQYINDIFNAPLMNAIERYQGVAYDYLKYTSLNSIEQDYLKKNTIIFSNLYGPILGGDTIANYKVKQGNSIGSIIPEKFYKDRFTYQLDLYLQEDEILDLRAGYYDKFYKITKPYTSMKFMKNGKVVSHWAKAYRGIVLKHIAQNNIQNISDLLSMQIDNLSVIEIKKQKFKSEIVYNIND